MHATPAPYPGVVSLRLHDTATRMQRDFVPLRAGAASMYVCGATVQGLPHIGHVRSSLNYDVLRRWLAHGGLDVALVRNVTDIDDKILRKSAEAGRPWWEWAATHERAFSAAFDALGCLPASVEPRATGHVTQMVELIDRLIGGGHAYASGGDVYFAVRSFPGYGELSHQKVDDVAQGEGDIGAKRDAQDFTLWKAAKPGEPSWPTPWGRGRPGWHLECSAMATFYLGPEFDIHGGGLDLVFPHHENERAQSRSLGHPFARIWMHNGMLELSDEKMSKSLGNVVTLREALDAWGREALLVFHLTAVWNKPVDFDDVVMAQAAARAEGFRDVFRNPHEPAPEGAWERFAAALDDDFNTPTALAVMHEWRDHELLRRALSVFGLESLAEEAEAPAEIVDLAARRQAARESRDFDEADRLRDELEAAGWEARDESDGYRLVKLR